MNCCVCLASNIHHFHLVSNGMGFDYYCVSCYEGYLALTGMKSSDPIEYKGPKCECGMKTAIGQNHSNWCGMYRKEL
jgi:hypothetical protein